MKQKFFPLLVLAFILAACAPSNSSTPEATSIQSTSHLPTITLGESTNSSLGNPPIATLSSEITPGEAEIEIEDFAFTPQSITILSGTTVKWANKDDSPHSVVGDDGSWSSVSLSKGDSYSFLFDQVGTFEYHCGFHPSMTGLIIVVAQ